MGLLGVITTSLISSGSRLWYSCPHGLPKPLILPLTHSILGSTWFRIRLFWVMSPILAAVDRSLCFPICVRYYPGRDKLFLYPLLTSEPTLLPLRGRPVPYTSLCLSYVGIYA